MVLEKLGSGLKNAIRKLTNAGYVDAKVVDELVRDIQRTLLSGDVDVKLVFKLTEQIKKRALDEKPPTGLTAREHIVRIVYEELVQFVGIAPEIKIQPQKILLIGLFGSGKTTSAGKLANFFQRKGLKPALIGCDIHRPAAMAQLEQLGKQLNVPVYTSSEKDANKIARDGSQKLSKNDVLIFDSSGRDALDGDLADEIKQLEATIAPDEVLLTLPADIGQAAGPQVSEFNRLVGITGVLLTKLDGTARGGGAITACAITGSPIKFIGVGEKMTALEIFSPERFISRLIGMGDLQALMERAKDAIDEKDVKKIQSRLQSGKFTLSDFYEQIKSMQKMGPLSGVMNMLPGGGMKLPKGVDLSAQEDKMKRWKFAIESFTPEEKENPEILNSSRIERISRGSGVPESEIRLMLNQFKKAKKVAKMMSGGRGNMLGRLMKKFGGR
jgi:signal recognition particle subunit SRP54